MLSTIFKEAATTADVQLGASDHGNTRVLVLAGTWAGTVELLAVCPVTGEKVLFNGLSFTEKGAYPVIIPRGFNAVCRFTHTSGALTATLSGG